MPAVLRSPFLDSSFCAAAVALALGAFGAAQAATVCSVNRAAADFGVFDKPFAADSPWNSRPVSPVFGTDTIPASTYFPFFFQAEDGIRALYVTGVQTCALPI